MKGEGTEAVRGGEHQIIEFTLTKLISNKRTDEDARRRGCVTNSVGSKFWFINV